MTISVFLAAILALAFIGVGAGGFFRPFRACLRSAPQSLAGVAGPRAFAASTFHSRDIGLGAFVCALPSAVSSTITDRATTWILQETGPEGQEERQKSLS